MYNKKLDELAIFGGKPTFKEAVHVNKPNIGNTRSFKRYVRTILKNKIFTNNGPYVQELSLQLAEYLEVEHCILVNNGTSAMSLLIEALGLEGEVIIPSFTFISTAHTLIRHGITPVFCDIDPITWNIDICHCQSLVTDKTSAIIATHLWGRGCCVSELDKIAKEHKIKLIFDSAHAFGNKIEQKKIGGFGNAEVFSFHATKAFHTFEGGAISTNDSNLAQTLEKIRNFGFTAYDEVSMVGTNAKMPEICAAVGLANFEVIDSIFHRNQLIYDKYKENLNRIKGISIENYNHLTQFNYQYVVATVDSDLIGLNRDQIIDILHHENIIARKYFFPGNHNMLPYSSLFPEAGFNLPVTSKISQIVMLLPSGASITENSVNKICSLLRIIVNQGPLINSKLDRWNTSGTTAQRSRSITNLGQRNKPLENHPKVEIRIPLSATPKYLRMLHYFLESLQKFGGPIARSAKCHVFVSRDQLPIEIAKEYPWVEKYDVIFTWLDQNLFNLFTYDATGFYRYQVDSNADIIIIADADILISQNFDNAIMKSFTEQKLLGTIAHVSPFDTPAFKFDSTLTWWKKIFSNANLPLPEFDNVHTGWGLMSTNKHHRSCPFYVNYGFIIVPKKHSNMIGETFIADLLSVEKVLNTWFKSQIAHTLSIFRHQISYETLPLTYNFPLHVSDLKLLSLSQNRKPENRISEIKIFHYLGNGKFNREDFSSAENIINAIERVEISDAEKYFVDNLRILQSIIKD